MDRPRAVAGLRAVLADFAANWLSDAKSWCVAVSGGPDSLALAAAAAATLPTTALIVDHGLQPGSESVAATAAEQAIGLGCVRAEVLRVQVGSTGGPEAAARSARYRALDVARNGMPVLIGHTLDDQAETVLLGLGRGSGARSIAGMRPSDPPWYRPFLGQRRISTGAACVELGLSAWEDPHNSDSRFTRVRLRTEVLPLLEQVLGGGVAEALARTASALREDTDALDALAGHDLLGAQFGDGLNVAAVQHLSAALRRRVIRAWLLAGGARRLTDPQIRAVDALVTAWRGQGPVAVGSDLPYTRLLAQRGGAILTLRREPV